MAAVDHYRTSAGTNAQGGDLGHHASQGLLVRHTVNYLLAAEVAGRVNVDGPLLDVGSGVGVFAAWLARRLGRPLHIADHDPRVLRIAQHAFSNLTAHGDVEDAPPAAVVTAMEVLEHIPYGEQADFVTAVVDRVQPGGVLVCSTPDERRYIGGWSGYAPHVGTLDPDSLRTLLHSASGGLPVHVWRINGPGFELRTLRRIGEPIANRLWAAIQSHTPSLGHRVAGGLGRRRRERSTIFDPGPPDDSFVLTDGDGDGTGTGLLAAVFKSVDTDHA